MNVPLNPFKDRLRAGQMQCGLWCTLGSASVTEVVAGAGFDWLLIDMEHSPNDPLTVLSQLQVVAGFAPAPVVRLPHNDPILFKRMLDFGAQSFMVPDIRNARQASEAVAAIRYPPAGNRGVSAVTRATRYGRVQDYPALSDASIALVVQIESPAAIDQIEKIAAVDGVDALFVGPGDLAAQMGFIGELGRPEVKERVEQAIRRIVSTGKAAGLLTGDLDFASRCQNLGASLVAVGTDAGILARGADALATRS